MEEKLKEIKYSALQDTEKEEPESPFEHGMVQFQVAQKVSQSQEGQQQIGMFNPVTPTEKSSIPVRKRHIHEASPFGTPPPGASSNSTSAAQGSSESANDASNVFTPEGQRNLWKLMQQMDSSLEDIFSIVERGDTRLCEPLQ